MTKKGKQLNIVQLPSLYIKGISSDYLAREPKIKNVNVTLSKKNRLGTVAVTEMDGTVLNYYLNIENNGWMDITFYKTIMIVAQCDI